MKDLTEQGSERNLLMKIKKRINQGNRCLLTVKREKTVQQDSKGEGLVQLLLRNLLQHLRELSNSSQLKKKKTVALEGLEKESEGVNNLNSNGIIESI